MHAWLRKCPYCGKDNRAPASMERSRWRPRTSAGRVLAGSSISQPHRPLPLLLATPGPLDSTGRPRWTLSGSSILHADIGRRPPPGASFPSNVSERAPAQRPPDCARARIRALLRLPFTHPSPKLSANSDETHLFAKRCVFRLGTCEDVPERRWARPSRRARRVRGASSTPPTPR